MVDIVKYLMKRLTDEARVLYLSIKTKALKDTKIKNLLETWMKAGYVFLWKLNLTGKGL